MAEASSQSENRCQAFTPAVWPCAEAEDDPFASCCQGLFSGLIDAVKLHRCPTCEETSHKRPTHKTALPHNYSFNHSLGIDVFEVVDVSGTSGSKFQVLNMVDLGPHFNCAKLSDVELGWATFFKRVPEGTAEAMVLLVWTSSCEFDV